MSEIKQYIQAALVKDVKKLIEAMENGQTSAQLKSEVTRLHKIIVDGNLQDIVIEECGEESYRKVFTTARIIKPKKKGNKKKTKIAKDVSDEEKEKKKLNKALRKNWLKWFENKYYLSIQDSRYYGIRAAAYTLDFVTLRDSTKTAEEFFQKGLSECICVAKKCNYFKESVENKKEVEYKTYSKKSSPHITRKDWGSPYKPARG